MARLAILIDGEYLSKVARDDFRSTVNFELLPNHIREIVASTETEPLDLLRTYMYDALPYLGEKPSEDDTKRHSDKSRFFDFLRRLPKFEVREGWVAHRGRDARRRPRFEQKQVDVLLGLDIALLSARRLITHMAVVSGDSDLEPAIEAAKNEGVVVWLFHGPQNRAVGPSSVAQTLIDKADMRYEIDDDFINKVRRNRQ